VTVRSEQGDLDSKLVVVEGDIEKSNDLGIDDVIKRRLLDDVSVVFHLAATVSFNEPLRYLTCFDRLIVFLTQVDLDATPRVPTPPRKSWIFFLKFPGAGKSLETSFVLENPGN